MLVKEAWNFLALAQPIATRLNCCTTHLLARKWGHMLYNIQQSYHNEHTHFCREMCNIVNTRFLRPFGVITEITTKSPQKLYNGSFFGPFFTQKSFFSPLKSF